MMLYYRTAVITGALSTGRAPEVFFSAGFMVCEPSHHKSWAVAAADNGYEGLGLDPFFGPPFTSASRSMT